jgi:hypothetical protein
VVEPSVAEFLLRHANQDIRSTVQWLEEQGYEMTASQFQVESSWSAVFVYTADAEVWIVCDRSQWYMDIAPAPGDEPMQYDRLIAASRSGAGRGKSVASGAGVAMVSPVLGHVDDSAVRVADKESAESPVFVRERIDDVGPSLDGSGENRVNVVDLDGDVRMDSGLDIQAHDTELHLGVVRTEE